MRKWLTALMLLVVLLLSACSNTVEGLEDDANRNIDEAQQEIDEEDNDD
jgi:predicted small secreted protein